MLKLSDSSKHFRKSFRTRVFYLFITLIITLYLSFTGFFIYYQWEMQRQELINEGRLLAGLLAFNSRLGVFSENADLLKDPVEGIMQQKGVILVQVFTADGRQLKTTAKPQANTLGHLDGQAIKKLRRLSAVLYSEDKNNFEFLAPVITSRTISKEEDLFFSNISLKNDGFIGFIRLIFTKELLHKSLSALVLKSIVIPVILIAPGWFIAHLIVRRMTKPLIKLTEGVKELEAGGSAKEVAVETEDEIGQLSQAFNNMVESLRIKEAQREELESQLRHAQKMEALGVLAGGIAHDFNNILTTITSYGHLLKKVSSDEKSMQYLEQVLSCTRRGASLTKGLLTFSRRQMFNPVNVNLHDIVNDTKDILQRLLSKDIELKFELAKDKLTVLADMDQIELALINLATNAADAMPNGGTLTITTADSQNASHLSKEGKIVQSALITVTDSGMGMDEKTKAKIFDPFFTTKDVGKGTGLGLSIVYGIIKQHNGSIDVISEPGNGTTFSIYLPLSGQTPKTEEGKTAPSQKEGTETILFAEDDEDVRLSIAISLKRYGYSIISAVDGEDAVKKFIENKDEVDLLLFDLIMPGKDGIEAYEEIKKITPDIAAIFISGHTRDVLQRKGAYEKEINLLLKPVSPDDIAKKIRDIMLEKQRG